MGTTTEMTKNLGGDRLGSGAKMNVDFHAYNRSNHDLSKAWRSTMNVGTLVPFLKIVALNGDTFSIDLETLVRTVPAVEPLYGSYKMQLDVFLCPIRLYNGLLHNNMLNIGLNMKQVRLPSMTISHVWLNPAAYTYEIENSQIASDSLLHYFGIKGLGDVKPDAGQTTLGIQRTFPAVAEMAYYDIYKNYYANKQEERGFVITPNLTNNSNNLTTMKGVRIAHGQQLGNEIVYQFMDPAWSENVRPTAATADTYQTVNEDNGVELWDYRWTIELPEVFDITNVQLIIYNDSDQTTQAYNLQTAFPNYTIDREDNKLILGVSRWVGDTNVGDYKLMGISYDSIQTYQSAIKLQEFPLENIDNARIAVLQNTGLNNELNIGTLGLPYQTLTNTDANGQNYNKYHQNGLCIKTYQSDLLNNWLNTEWIDGVNGITEITKVDTSSGSFAIDALNLAKKIYNMMNRIAASGGSYEDWQEAVYSVEANRRAESPIYMGGLSSEIVFEEVVSQTETPDKPLGSMAGKGTQSNKRGGHIEIAVTEPSYIIGIASITPRVDYSQGNDWEIELRTIDDLHKPALDGVGFEDLLQERGAWWGTYWDNATHKWIKLAIGKVPAWINYMTALNETHGEFAEPNKRMTMTLNRRYEYRDVHGLNRGIKDMTTYVDPTKYNYTFADITLGAQNFWVQIGMKIEARRVMSAKLIPTM